jgi:curved DNA-binding protein CbpA
MKGHLDPYAVLGVPRDASEAQIRRAYRRTARRVHPDVASGVSEDMALVNEAWFLLRDPARRAAHDAHLDAGETPLGRADAPRRAEPSTSNRATRLLQALVAAAALLCVVTLFLILFIGNTRGPTSLP